MNLAHVMDKVSGTAKYLRKNRRVNQELACFLDAIDAPFRGLSLYISWSLSRAQVLTQFSTFFVELRRFLEENSQDVRHFNDPAWECGLAFLTDICTHLNDLNQALQGNMMCVVQLFEAVRLFQEMLGYYIQKFEDGNLSNFTFCEVAFTTHGVTDMAIYISRLRYLKLAFGFRFGEFRSHTEDFAIFGNPFSPDLSEGAR